MPFMLRTVDGPVGTCERHPGNRRGDLSTVMQRKESVERIGVLTGVRSGAWLLPRDEVSVILISDSSTGKRTTVQRYWLLHWASLYEGVRAAVESDVQRSNKVVQLSLTQGLSGCRVFHQRTPKYIREYIIDAGNEVNADSSATTFLQVLLSHDVVEAAWSKKKSQFGWTISSESQSSLGEKKFSCAQGLFPNRWKSYHMLELSGSFYRIAKAPEVVLVSGELFWDGFWSYCQQMVADCLSKGPHSQPWLASGN